MERPRSQGFFDFCEHQVAHGGMDRKWFPDFVRVLTEFEYTQTPKVLVCNLKRLHFDVRRLEGESICWRRRGDSVFSEFSPEAFGSLRGQFERSERVELLDR